MHDAYCNEVRSLQRMDKDQHFKELAGHAPSNKQSTQKQQYGKMKIRPTSIIQNDMYIY